MAARTLDVQRQWTQPKAIYAAISLTMLGSFFVTIVLWTLDDRTLEGLSVWSKPLKFELALAVHAGTLALVISCLSQTLKTGFFMRVVAFSFLAACMIEMSWIIAQAAMGQHSHFNDSTAIHRAMFSTMAFCAVIITGAAGAVAAVVWRDTDFAAPAPIKAGVVMGLLSGAILTLVTAFAIGGHGTPYVEHVPDLASRMVLTGWSLSGGDLRVAHFLATHMMQVVPIAAILIAYLSSDRAKLPLLLGITSIWSAWVLLEFYWALAGQSSILLMVLF